MSCLVTAGCSMFCLSEERPLLASRGGCQAARLLAPNSCLNLGPQGGRTPPVGPTRSQDPSDLSAFTLVLSLKTGRGPACGPPLEFVSSARGLTCIPSFPVGSLLLPVPPYPSQPWPSSLFTGMSATVSDGSGTHWSHAADMILVADRNTLLPVTLVPRSQPALSQGGPRVRSPQSEA